MSTLHFGTDAELLAGRLVSHLDQTARAGDFFAPTTVVVPHRSMARWLKLWLARHRGIAINLRTQFLEAALWEMLREVDPRPQDPMPELLDADSYRLLVLSILLDEKDSDLDPWRDYLHGTGNPSSQSFCRRLWHLADRLATHIRDYEYHRQDALIQHWLKDELGLGPENALRERAQKAIFRAITREPDGKRARLNRAWKRNFKTLPQYAMEVMEYFALHDPPPPAGPLRTLHLFGLPQLSTLHATTLRWLGRFFDLQLYHVNPLAGRLPARPTRPTLQKVVQSLVEADEPADSSRELVRVWGKAGAESLGSLAPLLTGTRVFQPELVPTPRRNTGAAPLFAEPTRDTVLARLQDHLLHGTNTTGVPEEKLPQDRSLQIVPCPGMIREVETVFSSIIANLQERPEAKPGDIAVLVTDMERYRPLLQAVFERQTPRLAYNLSAFTAAGLSTFAQAVEGMLDLALGAFARSQVFAVLLNPCFLARFGIERGQALIWLDWAQALGIYQGWDRDEKKERGHADSPLFAWRLGLQRLRLGRIMEVGRDDASEPLPCFGPVVPYADLASGDVEKLDAFCRAVEGLLPTLTRLRRLHGSAERWVSALEKLMQDFLAVPDDRPEEAQVWDRLVQALRKWLLWDHLGAEPQRLSLALVRQMVHGAFEDIQGAQGEFLGGGVTVAPLQLLQPVPFRIVYVLGLGEDLFPGSNALSGLDLRDAQRLPGDIRPAEHQRGLLLQAVLAPREKLYLLYDKLNIQKDQELHPCVPLQQLQRYVSDHVLGTDFALANIPLLASDPGYLQPAADWCDVVVQFAEVDRLLAVQAGQNANLLLSAEQLLELETRLARRRAGFSLVETGVPLARSAPTVTVKNLAKYIESPVLEALKYHLYLSDDDEEDSADDEPFVTSKLTAINLLAHNLNHLVLRSVRGDLGQALAEWPGRFAQVYRERTLQGQLPEDAFGEVDQAMLREDFDARLMSPNGLKDFLAARPGRTFCGPILLGESVTPIGAQQRFPALKLDLTRSLPQLDGRACRLVGSMPLAWRNEASFDILVWSFREKSLRPAVLSRYLLEPFLFYLALRAGDEGHPSSTAWLGERTFRIHVAHLNGVLSYTYHPEETNPEQARAYLSELASDFLDPACFDLLPLKPIIEQPALARAFMLPNAELGDVPERFAQDLEEALDEDDGWGSPPSVLTDLVCARVPLDAFAKTRRRLRPIDQGPRRNRDGGGS